MNPIRCVRCGNQGVGTCECHNEREPRHTPGPWKRSKSGACIDLPDGSQVRFIRQPSYTAGCGNLDLVQRAPDMATVLLEIATHAPHQSACGIWGGRPEDETVCGVCDCYLADVRTVLTKAGVL